MMAKRRRTPGMRADDDFKNRNLDMWTPKTRLGQMVKNGEIKTITELMQYPEQVKETEIIDMLIPDLKEEIINVGRVQRVTDSGRRTRFKVIMAVGNGNGYIGIGGAKGKEAGPTIRKAIDKAKMNLKEIKRGCGSWECGCKTDHSVPFTVSGKMGSVRVILIPAPKGTGLVSGEIAKKVLSLAGVKDVWVHTEGHARTNLNFAEAVLDALYNTNCVRVGSGDIENLGIVEGSRKVAEDGKV